MIFCAIDYGLNWLNLSTYCLMNIKTECVCMWFLAQMIRYVLLCCVCLYSSTLPCLNRNRSAGTLFFISVRGFYSLGGRGCGWRGSSLFPPSFIATYHTVIFLSVSLFLVQRTTHASFQLTIILKKNLFFLDCLQNYTCID